jgi:hypothetical protein
MRSGAGKVARVAMGIALVLAALVAPPSAQAADGVVVGFESPSAASTFPVETVWRQTFRSERDPVRVELMTRLAGTDTWLVEEVPFSAAAADTYAVDYIDLGFQLPNSRIEYRFRVTPAGGPPETGPQGVLAVSDDRIDWQTIEGDLVRLHWQSGDRSFARRALRVAEDAVAETAALLGVTETEPIDFYLYADSADFQSALGPGTKEFVAGRAIAEIRTLFAVVESSDIGSPWLSIVVPHELAHLVFDTATRNPYHQPPHWLNEGLAVYLSERYGDDDRRRVANAIERGTLLPLSSLTEGFPSAREELFYLGYAEGTSAIDYFVRAHGQEKLVQLIRAYAAGVTDDEAFESATGEGFEAFETAWLADIGAASPEAQGPRDAAPGPTPSAWAGGGGGRPVATDAGVPSGVLPGETDQTTSDMLPTAALAALVLVAGLLIFAVVVSRLRRMPIGPPRSADAPDASATTDPPRLPPGDLP